MENSGSPLLGPWLCRYSWWLLSTYGYKEIALISGLLHAFLHTEACRYYRSITIFPGVGTHDNNCNFTAVTRLHLKRNHSDVANDDWKSSLVRLVPENNMQQVCCWQKGISEGWKTQWGAAFQKRCKWSDKNKCYFKPLPLGPVRVSCIQHFLVYSSSGQSFPL